MQTLENKIGYTFKNKQLLQTALTHSSYSNEKGLDKSFCYERLEFLGDSILGLTAAELLYRHESKLPEGRMTKLRSELVCEKSLFVVASELNLGTYMRLGKGEEKSGGRQRVSVLADMVEAIIAAIYLDSDMSTAQSFIYRFVLPEKLDVSVPVVEDYKTKLQEILQTNSENKYEYVMLSESGPDHNKSFLFALELNGVQIGAGKGRSKKEAEQQAAKSALEYLEK